MVAIKKWSTASLFCCTLSVSYCQSVGIGSSQFTPSAMLEIRSTNNTAGTYGFKLLNSSSSPMLFIQNNGNVGIGTSTPATILDLGGGTAYVNSVGAYQMFSTSDKIVQVRNSAQSVLNLVSDINTNGGTIGSIAFTRSTGQGDAHMNVAGIRGLQSGTGTTSGGMLSFWVKSAGAPFEAMRIDLNGNTGIGTTNPVNKLDVEGGAVVGANYSGTNTAPSNGLLVEGYTGMGTTSAATKLDIRGTSANAAATIQIVGNGVSTLLLGQNASGGVIRGQGGSNALMFYTGGSGDQAADGSGSERVRIDANGNVGIGDNNPQYLLSLKKAGTAGATLDLLNLFNTEASYTANSGLRIVANYGGGHPLFGVGGNIQNGGSGAASYMTLQTNTSGSLTEKVRILSDGNVGVGTTTPVAPLDIFRASAVNAPMISIRSDFTATGKFAMIRFGDQTQTSSYQKGAIIYEGVSAAARGRFHIALENTDGGGSVALSDARLTVLSNGNTGIGTTNPGETLEVMGNVRLNNTLSEGARLILRGGTGGTQEYRARVGSSGMLSFFHTEGGGDVITLSRNNNVMLGNFTETTTDKLGILAAAGQTSLMLTDGSNSTLRIKHQATPLGNTILFNGEGTSNMVFATNSGNRMTITSTGNIGIGTSTVGAKLHIENGHSDSQFWLHSTGDGGAINSGDLFMWASEPGVSWDGVGIANNWKNSPLGRVNTNRGGSYIRLLNNHIQMNVVNSAGASTTAVFIDGAGNVGLGAAAGARLDVGTNGDGTVARANAWNNFSDVRWKKDISPISNGLALVEKLQGVNYTWKATDKKDFGFIAQEVEKVLPLAVHTDDKGYKSVDYARITSVLVEAVKEQQKKIDSQQKIIDELKAANQILKTESTQQEKRLQKIERFFSEINGNNVQTKK